ncbi:MAG: hypothetical protein QNJ65_15600 [Xenococcaceae cyanobacterium MO_234.B1]|nr:hypothetical protein [Xenococcaceae cyanobacterium MO_234.B1]
MNFELERKISNILIPAVDIPSSENVAHNNFEELFQIHCLKKQLFSELVEGEASFEEILEALETFIGTSNMDGYLLEIEPKLNNLCDLYGVPD